MKSTVIIKIIIHNLYFIKKKKNNILIKIIKQIFNIRVHTKNHRYLK